MGLQGELIKGDSMKYFFILILLAPLAAIAQVSGPQAPSRNEALSGSAGYVTKDCDKKCTKNQQCTLNTEDERYYCLGSSSSKTPKPLEVYISCKGVGGTYKRACSTKEIAVSVISGKSQIPIREDKPGQCCIAKSKLKVN